MSAGVVCAEGEDKKTTLEKAPSSLYLLYLLYLLCSLYCANCAHCAHCAHCAYYGDARAGAALRRSARHLRVRELRAQQVSRLIHVFYLFTHLLPPFEPSSLEQLLINHANEKLQGIFNRLVILEENAKCAPQPLSTLHPSACRMCMHTSCPLRPLHTSSACACTLTQPAAPLPPPHSPHSPSHASRPLTPR